MTGNLVDLRPCPVLRAFLAAALRTSDVVADDSVRESIARAWRAVNTAGDDHADVDARALFLADLVCVAVADASRPCPALPVPSNQYFALQAMLHAKNAAADGRLPGSAVVALDAWHDALQQPYSPGRPGWLLDVAECVGDLVANDVGQKPIDRLLLACQVARFASVPRFRHLGPTTRGAFLALRRLVEPHATVARIGRPVPGRSPVPLALRVGIALAAAVGATVAAISVAAAFR